jgi:hypothetical protein
VTDSIHLESQAMQLNTFARNVTSQFGEDGILEEIFRRIGVTNQVCVEFGAWDGKHLSNTWHLWHEEGWGAVLIEGDRARYEALRASISAFPKVQAVHAFVTIEGENSLDRILGRCGSVGTFDLLSVDIDGDEYHVWNAMTRSRARVVVLEYNPTIPPELDLVQAPGAYFGASAKALVRLACDKGYVLAACTSTNCIFVNAEEFSKLGIPSVSLQAVFPRENLTYVINSYDGAMFINRNPTYSPRLLPLSASTLLAQAVRASRTPSVEVAPVEASSGLAPVRMFALSTDPDLKPLWVRVFNRVWTWFLTTPIGSPIKPLIDGRANRRAIQQWNGAGRPLPPPHALKQTVILEHARAGTIGNLVETGTYLGDMVEAVRRRIRRVVSIELDHALAERARARFARHSNVEILEGDSGTKLAEVLSDLREPALFWLDGHYSEGITAKGDKETPILEEIETICRHDVPGHIILVDDARCFDGTHDYPTLEEFQAFVRARKPGAKIVVSDDIIRIT